MLLNEYITPTRILYCELVQQFLLRRCPANAAHAAFDGVKFVRETVAMLLAPHSSLSAVLQAKCTSHARRFQSRANLFSLTAASPLLLLAMYDQEQMGERTTTILTL
jgi:hypothetical protein